MSTIQLFSNPSTITIAGNPLRFYDSKEKEKPPIVLLHGSMLDESCLIWHHVGPALTDEFRVIAIDFPRHGGSRPWQGEVDQAVLESVIESVLNELGIKRASIVGLSLGASIAIGYTLKNPDRVDRLVVAAPGGLEKRRQWQLTTWLMAKVPGLMRLTTKWLASSPDLVRKSIISNLKHKEKTKDIEVITTIALEEARAKETHKERALDDWQLLAYGPFKMKTYLMPDLDGIRVPTLLVRGEKDPLVSQKDVKEAVRRIEYSRLEVIPGAGHLSALDEPELFAQLVREHLLTK